MYSIMNPSIGRARLNRHRKVTLLGCKTTSYSIAKHLFSQ